MNGSNVPERPQIVRVLAAVCRRGNRYLVCKRPEHKRHGGLWEFPGGKLEPGESLLAAARRELREELAVHVLSIGTMLFARHDGASPFRIEFVMVEIDGEPCAIEHQEVRWVELEQIVSLMLAPADRAFVEEVLGRAS